MKWYKNTAKAQFSSNPQKYFFVDFFRFFDFFDFFRVFWLFFQKR